MLHRLLVRDIQQQIRGETLIEPTIAICFHNGQILTGARRFVQHNSDDNSDVQYFDP
jgi:hypothetical protein